ncbi:coiled-coil domain-containing protein 40 isoform X2 [Ictalurus furcatus]|uniref:coiled-coil domain-containing protein 40 isoform X2 n=1 Tax=Ictalurus furcatus TaxID=66913 RepID=UPI0023507F5D|nr:coiled-coil domain-containing protein 40 isoform X2 [Ictalurus furcatus]
MERAEKREDEDNRETPHDEEETEAPEDDAEVPSDISASQQEQSTEDLEREHAETSADVSHTHTTASVITHTQTEQDSGSAPEPPPSSLHLTLGYNSTVAFTDSEGDERARPSRNNEDVDNEDEDDEDELVVLDPEHPLVKRFQLAVKNHLTRQLESLDLKLHEKVMEERAENSRREDLAIRLYNSQQELAREQAILEARHESCNKAISDRRQAEEQLEKIRNQYSSMREQASKHRTQVSELQSEADVLARRLRYMQEVTSDLRSDVSAMKNAKNKAQAEKRQAEQQKYQQDLYVEHLTKQVEKLREQIALFQMQTLAQTNDKQAARDALSEAQLELDSMIVEKKQLLQQWNSSLMGMKRRDEAYTVLQEALWSANHEVRALDTEAEGYRRSITLAQEQNEALTVLLNRVELKSATYRKLLKQIHTQQEVLQNLYTVHSRTLQETEKSLCRVDTECNTRQSELTILKKQIEKEAFVRMELEEKIMRKMQEQLTHDSAAKHTRNLSTKTMTQLREKEAQISKVESELAAVELEVSELALHVEALSRQQLELEQEVMKRNQLLLTKEAAVAKLILTVERKQATINLYNKKIEQIRASTGHDDLGPLEIEVRALNKQLEELGAKMKEQHQLWLWQQGELVRLTQEKQAQSSATLTLNTQLTILQQRTLHTKSQIEQEERGLVEIERHSKVLKLDMQKLHSLLNQNTQLRQELEQSNILMENSFIHTLKDAERESVETQLRLEKLQEEKEGLLNNLAEAERQIMLWERKTQLARETRSAVDSEVGKGDMHTMKAEIHRMERHYNQLLKQRERMLREMEAAVARRENIVTRNEAQTRRDSKHNTHIYLQNTLQNLRRNILQTHKQAEECDGVITQLQQKQSSLSESLREKQTQITDGNNASSAHIDELNNMQETRERNLTQLLALQSRVKQLQAVKEGRYSAAAKGEDALQLATCTLQEQLRLIRDVLQQVIQDFPQHKNQLNRISLLLSAHTHYGLERT